MWHYLVILFLVINLKSLPLAYHVRFYSQLFTHFVLYKSAKPRSVFESRSFTTITTLLETDFNLHKSNSTYFLDMDIARTDLMTHVFKDFFLKFDDKIWTYCPLGSVMAIFRREIKPYQPFRIRSRVLGWDSKWIFVLSRFETLDGKLCSVCVSKYVFKLKKKTIPVPEVVKFCGLDGDGALEKGLMGFEKVKELLEIESLTEEKM